MKDDVEQILEFLQNHESEKMRDLYTAYASKVRNVMASRILIQVSKLYSTIKFPRLIRLLPNMTRQEVERMIVDASRIGQLRVRIDHSKDMINFGLESDPAPLYVDDETSLDSLSSYRNDQNEWVSNHLNALARVLETAITQLRDDEETKKLARAKNYKNYQATRQREPTKLKQRRDHIEQIIVGCENDEKERILRDKETKKAAEEAAKKREVEIEIKAKEDADAKKKAAAEKAEVVRQYQDKLDSLRKTDFGSKLFEGMTAETLMTKYSGDIEDFVNERMEKMKMDRREAQEKIRKQERSFDYNERAKRRVELEKIKKYVDEEQQDQRKLWDMMEDERLKNLREEWETSRETKNRLAFMKSDAEAFQDQLKKDRRQAYMEKKKNFDLEVAAERAKRLEERREKRIEERREKWLDDCRREEERLRAEEEAPARKAEEDRLEAERQAEMDRQRKMKEDQPVRYQPPGRDRRMSPPRDDRGPPPRGYDDRGPPRRGFSPDRRDDPRGPPRRFSPDRRSPPRRMDRPWGPPGGRGGSPGRRSPPRRMSPGRRSPPRRSPPGPWRRGPSPGRGPRRGSPPRDAWRRGPSPPRGGPRRGDSPPRRGGPPHDDGPRGPRGDPGRGPPPKRDGPPPPRNDAPAEDGWETAVKRK